jgi:hypothetical protein
VIVPPDVHRYGEIRGPSQTGILRARVREAVLFRQPRTLSELELQARWFAGDFGRHFKSTSKQDIEIVQFGTWNREPGPDFRDAAIRIGNAEPVRGCVEIDLIDRNWELHGHATNPAFDETALHVFVTKNDREFFTRTTTNRNVPQIRIDPAVLSDAFRLETALARPGRCCAPLRNLPEDRVRSILDAAAQFRLQRKSAALRAKIDNHTRDEGMFQEIAAALGYKENKLPFTLIAQRLPLKVLRDLGDDREAVLFGVAGFLGTPDLGQLRRSAKSYVRELWDRWWPHRDEFQRLVLPMSAWKASSTRPSNHPQRRLAALSVVAHKWSSFHHSLGKESVKSLRDFLTGLHHPFWKTHFTVSANASTEPMALIGESRATEILANVVFPYWHIEHAARSARTTASPAGIWAEYSKLPARLTNRRLETGAVRLFGDDPRQKDFLRTVAHQQGLLQIFEDFCLQDNSDCGHCPFPEQMNNWP